MSKCLFLWSGADMAADSWAKKKAGWFTVILCDPSFRIPGTATAISDVFGNFGMCHLVGERPSERHPERHWNDLLNIRI